MNKAYVIASVAFGLLLGGGAGLVSSPTVSQNFESRTHIVTPTQDGSEKVRLRSSLSLKRSGQYEMYFLTGGLVGFNTAGHYHFSAYGLALMPFNAEQVVPEGKTLSTMETMFSQRGMHSIEDLTIIPYSESQIILVAPRYSYLFSTIEQ
ncbi:hypothetical protein ACODM8_01050 [Vibrio ostreicida]|uniref:Uncharacterized protein n=1 Tax=Vibrio ostreicida TaxID=526588 RepID=A0ABT8BT49_9VIBR|nr:hypothetical protein [Vibrio ostreicida]MDN3609849.1 hypothetical protein [Vibrio ostreicida]NPD09971.1 hypothetical protein [Vibrio ostreicida]